MIVKIFFLTLILIGSVLFQLRAQEVELGSDLPSVEASLTESVGIGPGSIFPNPAVLALNRHQFLSGSYGSIHDNALQHLNLIYALHLRDIGFLRGDWGVIGVSALYDFTEVYDHAGVTVAYSKAVAGLLGLGVSVGLRGDTFSFPRLDINLGLIVNPFEDLYLGINFDDLVKLGRGNIGGGVSYSLTSSSFLREVNLNGQVRAVKGIDSFHKGGIELSLENENWLFPPLALNLPIDLVGNRVGVRVDVLNPERYNSFDAGLGLRMGEIGINYAYRYSFHSRLNNHRVTLSYHFSPTVDDAAPMEEKVEEGTPQPLQETLPEPGAENKVETQGAEKEPRFRRRTVEDMSVKDDEETRQGIETIKKGIKVYSGPGEFYPVVVELDEGDQLSITGSFDKWYKAVTSEGEEGWVKKEDLVERDIIIAE